MLEAFETLAAGLDHPEGIALGPDGALYAGGEAGQIYRIGPDGVVRQVASTGGFIGGVPDVARVDRAGAVQRGALFVVESHGREVVRIPIEEDGRAGPQTRVVRLPGSQPDGIALAEDGTMLVGCYRPDRLYAIAPDGTVEVLAEDADGVVLNQPANVAFVGERLDRIAVSSLGGWSVVVAPTRFRGLPLRYPSL